MIVIDPSKGGSNIGVKSDKIVEKDFNLLISNYIYERLKKLGVDTKIIREKDEYISETDRIDKILNAYGNNDKVIAISNMLDDEVDGVQIIYALRNTNKLAKLINDNLESEGINVSKYYQRRSEDDTSKDYYDIQRDTGNVETIIISYGNVNNESDNLLNNYKIYAESVIKSILEYKGLDYNTFDNIYIVKKGDTLYKIASINGTSVEKIKDLNNLSSNIIQIGQKLIMPSINSEDINQTYIVQKGDNLYSISKKFNTTVEKLKSINNLSSNLLQIGQILKLSDNNSIYIVQKGDSLYKIANMYGVSVSELKKLNNLSSNIIQIGMKLKIPN